MQYNSLTIDHCYEVARKSNGFCLSTEYTTSHQKYIWKCENNHIWTASYSSVNRGSWCPVCGKEKSRKTNVERNKQKNIKIIQEKYNNIFYFPSLTQDYICKSSKIKAVCLLHNKEFSQTINKFLEKSSGCEYCRKLSFKKPKKDKNKLIDQCKKMHKEDYDYSLIPTDVRFYDRIKIICKVHNTPFETTLRSIYTNEVCCPICLKERRELINSKNFFKSLYENFANLDSVIDISGFIYKDAHESSNIVCKKCNKSFKRNPNALLNNISCPFCSKSKGEEKIDSVLRSLNKIYSLQLRIKECRNKKPLPFDFAVFEDKEKTKLKCLIEYDGEQHFRVSTWFKNSNKDFEKSKMHDKIKDDFCKENNIKLIRIPYWDYKNIEEILTNSL